MSNVAEDAASVVALWRYPVKSMMGEELNAAEVTERGVLGDRPYALVDAETGKVASAKEPRKWAKLFEFRASFVEPPLSGERLPHVLITELPLPPPPRTSRASRNTGPTSKGLPTARR